MIEIRRFEKKDLEPIKTVVKEAFYREEKDPNFNEWNFVDDIRSDKDYVEELCLIAKENEAYLGYNILTKGSVGKQEGLILGPIAVRPSHQKKGIGKKLIASALEKAKDLAYPWVVLVGGDYYFQVGFESAKKYGVKIGTNAPGNDFVKIVFLDETKSIQPGTIKFADAFYSATGELL